MYLQIAAFVSLLIGLAVCPAWSAGPGFNVRFSTEIVCSTDSVSLIVTGDVLPESSWRAPFSPPEDFFQHVEEEFRSADIVYINLEEPITGSTLTTRHKTVKNVRAGKDFILRAKNSVWPQVFRESGVHVVNLANNHTMDYRAKGMLDTLKLLSEQGIKITGGGKNLSDALKPVILEKRGISVALIGFTDVQPAGFAATSGSPGIATAKDEFRMIEAIKSASRQSDFTVVMMHWGEHASSTVTARQTMLSRRIIYAGASAIVGMHPHFMQGIAFYKGSPVFYSLGNFAFPTKRPETRQTILPKFHFCPDGTFSVTAVPVAISLEGQPRIVDDEPEGISILALQNKLSKKFGTAILNGKLVHDQP